MSNRMYDHNYRYNTRLNPNPTTTHNTAPPHTTATHTATKTYAGAVTGKPTTTSRRQPKFEVIEGSVSQYSANSVSACTLISLEAASVLAESKTNLSPGTVDKIVRDGSTHSANQHLDVEEGLQLNGLKDRLEVDSADYNVNDFNPIHSKLRVEDDLVACVTTAAVTFAVAFDKTDKKWILFDSHTRPEHPRGAAFVIFWSSTDLFEYLHELFPSMPSEDGFDTQMFNMIDIIFVKQRQNPILPLSSSSSSSSSSSQRDEETERKLREKTQECEAFYLELQKQRERNELLLREMENIKRQLNDSNKSLEAKDREFVDLRYQFNQLKDILDSLKYQQ
jgi:hypothetical protein